MQKDPGKDMNTQEATHLEVWGQGNEPSLGVSSKGCFFSINAPTHPHPL